MLKIKINRKDFLKALQIVENAVFENKVREVLSGIYIEASNNKITLIGTDLELSIKTEIKGEIISEGKLVIKHKLIEEFLKQTNDDLIEFSEQEGKIVIKTDKTNSEFSFYSAENFPTIQALELGVEYKFNKEKLLDHIEKVKISASTAAENLAVNCIRFEIENGCLKLVASDTYRLTYIEEELDEAEKHKESLSISIPLKAIEGLTKIMKMIDEENVIFKSDGTKVFFEFSNIEILTRVIELQFPDYKSILANAHHDKKILLNTKDFLSVLKRTHIFVRDNTEAKNSGIFNFDNNKLFLTGVNENAKINEEIPTIQEGDNLKISLNVKFISDYISTIEGEVTELKLLNAKSSVLVKDEKNDKSLYFTMPLALKEE